MLHSFVSFLLTLTSEWGYWGVYVLMTVQSSFIPFPSEVVIPPAAFLASKGEMNIYWIIFIGLLGSLTGALVNYYLALILGKKTIEKLVSYRWAKFFLLDKSKLDKAEYFFVKHGEISTFLGRLVPGIRQLISISAGLAKMPFGSFIFYTGLGSGIWVTVLAVLGYQFGANMDLYEDNLKFVTAIVLLFVIAILAVYVFWNKKKRRS